MKAESHIEIIPGAASVPLLLRLVAVLIIVQVALDTMRKIEAQIYMNKYETLGSVGL